MLRDPLIGSGVSAILDWISVETATLRRIAAERWAAQKWVAQKKGVWPLFAWGVVSMADFSAVGITD